jgi:hypothetical protein
VLFPAWSRVLLLLLAERQPHRFQGVWSKEIIRELWRTIGTRSAARGRPAESVQNQALAMIYPLQRVLILVDGAGCPPGTPPSPLSDPNDTHLWYAAINAGAGYVVSHNTRDFPPAVPVEPATGSPRAMRHRSHGVEFLTAIEFIEDVLHENAAALYGRPLPAGVVRSRRTSQRNQDGIDSRGRGNCPGPVRCMRIHSMTFPTAA